MSHFQLQQDPTQDKFLDFLQTYFEFEDAFAPNFSMNGEQARCACAGPTGSAPPFIETIRSESVFKFKACFAKSQGIYLESGLVEV